MHQRGMDRAAVHERPDLLEHVGEGGTGSERARVPRPLFEVVVFSRRFAPTWNWTPVSEEPERPLRLD